MVGLLGKFTRGPLCCLHVVKVVINIEFWFLALLEKIESLHLLMEGFLVLRVHETEFSRERAHDNVGSL